MKYLIAEWERNGYHDSDFYVAIWDTDTKKMDSVMYGSTAFAGYIKPDHPPLNKADEQTQNEFRAWAVETASQIIHNGLVTEANEPNQVKIGDELVTIRKTKKKNGTVIEAGIEGRVFWQGAYGQFYAKGFNKPDRTNTRVGLEFKDGSKEFIALNACKRNVVIEPIEEVSKRMTYLMEDGRFNIGALTTCTAWLSCEYWK